MLKTEQEECKEYEEQEVKRNREEKEQEIEQIIREHLFGQECKEIVLLVLIYAGNFISCYKVIKSNLLHYRNNVFFITVVCVRGRYRVGKFKLKRGV